MNRKKSQSILEYVIVLAAIIAAIAIGVTKFAGRENEEQGVGKLMKKAGETIVTASEGILEQTGVVVTPEDE